VNTSKRLVRVDRAVERPLSEAPLMRAMVSTWNCIRPSGDHAAVRRTMMTASRTRHVQTCFGSACD